MIRHVTRRLAAVAAVAFGLAAGAAPALAEAAPGSAPPAAAATANSVRAVGAGAARALTAPALTAPALTARALTAPAVKLPAPCPLSPVRLVAPALGVPVSAVHGRVQNSKADGFSIVLCIFQHGPGLVDLTLAPAAYGQSGDSIPGLVTEHPTGLGPQGELLYDRRAGSVLTSAIFVKDGLWGDAYSNVKVPTATVLALGRYAYAHVVG